jgi:Flp pilus assembly CpaF family ATPase
MELEAGMDRPTTRNATDLLRGTLASLAPLFDDPAVTEIMLNAPGELWVQRGGRIERLPCMVTDAQVQAAVKVLARLSRRDSTAGTRDGMIDARFDGMRIAACLSPTAVRGHALCIRKHLRRRLSLAELVQAGCLDAGAARLLRSAVLGRCNLIIGGATDAGKTTFMNALLAEIPPHERLVTIEDTPELDVAAPNWVAFETSECDGISARDLVRLALRMRPDRILVGEVRGPEAFDLMQVANTGHRGSLATLHANDALGALSRLETLVLTAGVRWPFEAVQRQIAEAFDLVVFLARRHGVRAVSEIVRIDGFDDRRRRYLTTVLFNKEAGHGMSDDARAA